VEHPERHLLRILEHPVSGELMLPLPDSLLASQGWATGDRLRWRITPEGAIIRRVTNDSAPGPDEYDSLIVTM
jgi:hypothetical protein